MPCGKCDSCLSIARGDDIDVIEIDAASNTGVDNVREIIENAQYRPARSRFKIYIIDEVHMLSKSAFNALLKTLEEPPSHVKFILATTEPEKVLPTILSRCQRFRFSQYFSREIARHLKEICKKEKISAEEDAPGNRGQGGGGLDARCAVAAGSTAEPRRQKSLGRKRRGNARLAARAARGRTGRFHRNRRCKANAAAGRCDVQLGPVGRCADRGPVGSSAEPADCTDVRQGKRTLERAGVERI